MAELGRCWLGLDVGTSSIKGLLVDAGGHVHARADAAYGTEFGHRGEAEQDPRDYLRAAREVIAACRTTEVALGGIGLVGQTPTLVLCDEAGEPVRPALTWQDTRAEAEARELASTLGPSEPLVGLDLPWAPSFPPARLLWLSRQEPETVRRTRWALQPKDFVGFHLTGAPASDPWSTKGLCNVATLAPAEAVLRAAGWSADVVPPLAAAWTAAGVVSARAASALGLPAGTPVSTGWSDALAGMLAVGAFDEPAGFVLSGTSSIVGLSARAAGRADGSLLVIPSTCAPLPVVYGPTQSSGASVRWLADLLGVDVRDVLALAADADADAEPLLFVPYLGGERAPVWRTDVRGALLGLSARHGAAELAAAVIAGVCLSERHVLASAEAQAGAVAPEVRVGGRGSAEEPWRSARSAALARPLGVLAEPDASALGAAMLAAAAANDGDLAAAGPLRGAMERVEAAGSAGADAYERYLRGSGVCLAW